MARGLKAASLYGRLLSRCRRTTAALPLRVSQLGKQDVLMSSRPSHGARSYFSFRETLDDLKHGADYVEITGPNGELQSVRWADRPDVFGPIGDDDLPEWVDWTRWPAVNPIVDQGSNRVCWAHSAIDAVEGLNAIRTNHLVKLSEQQLIDCMKEYADPLNAMIYIVENGGILPNFYYPYVGKKQPVKDIVAPGVTIDSYDEWENMYEEDMKVLVATRCPIIATIGADKQFENYLGGVLDGPNYTVDEMEKKKIGHTVAIVSYGHYFQKPCWLVKNPWKDWGKFGFGLIRRDNGKAGGAFGIAREIVCPIKESPNNPAVRPLRL